jgi:DNA-binding FadR family transcriptional regulator
MRDVMAEVRALAAREHGLFERVMPTHIRILECVASGDAKSARSAMREHLIVALSIQKELIRNVKD